MTTPLNCPRCKSALPVEAQSCPRCGLRISQPVQHASVAPAQEEVGGVVARGIPEIDAIEPFDFQSLVSRGEAFDATESGTTFLAHAPEDTPGKPTTALHLPASVEASEEDASPSVQQPTSPNLLPATAQATQSTPAPVNPASASFTGPPNVTGAVASQSTLDLLPQEEVVQQLGTLYLTNKRVILLDASVIRSAFVRDIDAVGTVTKRAPVWQAILGGALLALAAGAVYAETARDSLEPNIGWAYIINPLLTALLFVVFGAFLLARYFLWVKRSLFVSVKGRPLITVSMADWDSRKLAGMDAFVNSFFQLKDFMSGDFAGRQVE